MSDADSGSGRNCYTHHSPAECARQINEITSGDELPYYLSWDESGTLIETPARVSEKICQLMRTLRHKMNSKQIAAGLDYSNSTISQHVRGKCGHWQPPVGIDFSDANRRPKLLTITDRERVVSIRGKQYYHAYADGVPACHRTGKSYKIWDDLEMAKDWKIPCDWCFPDRDDERPEAEASHE